MEENAAFISFDNTNTGLIFDDSSHTQYPIRYYNLINGRGFSYKEGCSYYGFVYSGNQFVLFKNGRIPMMLQSSMYFSTSTEFSVCGTGKMILIEVLHNKGIYPENKYRALSNTGGPIEKEGRLKYIDGCTDTLLIAPVKYGDPCLNHLHFPKNIKQTQHTHPSHRIGIVSGGEGLCVTPFGNMPLTKGMIFVIKEYDGETLAEGLDGKMYPCGQHSFDTDKDSMDVIAFHPDSDFGATDDVHPMINRTIVDGVSASKLDNIKTK
tara:strand:- start:16267 stop:17061 length:795 start_codon:yes stop_codon:yes gene_type:complete